jgi:hypothetical protein
MPQLPDTHTAYGRLPNVVALYGVQYLYTAARTSEMRDEMLNTYAPATEMPDEQDRS